MHVSRLFYRNSRRKDIVDSLCNDLANEEGLVSGVDSYRSKQEPLFYKKQTFVGRVNETIHKSRALSALSMVFTVFLVVCAIGLVGVRFVGLSPYYVLSGSMEPAISTGSMLYVAPVDISSLAEGDVITYQKDNRTAVTHRIVEIQHQEGSDQSLLFRTKGDANSISDGTYVSESEILGSPVCIIPFVGYVAYFIQSPVGLVIAAAGCGLWGFSLLLPVLLYGKQEELSSSR